MHYQYLLCILGISFPAIIFTQAITPWCADQTTNGTLVSAIIYEEELWTAGFFNTICDESAGYVARLSNEQWEAMGAVSDPGHQLRILDGELYLARYENQVDSNWLFRWSGNEWEKIGEGVYLTTATPGFSELPNIYDVALYNDQLVICGEFDRVGAQHISHIAAWNGTQWTPLGSGLSGNIPNTASVQFPHQLLVWEDHLYVAGNFQKAGGETVNGIARWDGSDWEALGEGFNSTAYGIGVYNGELYVGGDFTQSGNTPLNRIAKWNGSSWVSPGFGFIANNQDDYVFVHTIKEINEQLYLAGGLKAVEFEDGSTAPCGGVVAFNGSTVLTFSGGVANRDIEALAALDDQTLFVGGGVFGTGFLGVIDLNTATSYPIISKLGWSPNPTSGLLYGAAPLPSSSGDVRIMDMNGQICQHLFWNGQDLDVSRLPAGVYWVEVKTATEIYRDKIVIQF